METMADVIYKLLLPFRCIPHMCVKEKNDQVDTEEFIWELLKGKSSDKRFVVVYWFFMDLMFS